MPLNGTHQRMVKREEDWQWVPDVNWNLQLIDINAVDPDPEPYFNAERQTVFHLFTRDNPTSSQILALHDVETLRRSNFDANRQTRFVVHGWNNDAKSPLNTAVRNAYLTVGDFNVIIVDWGKGANTINYISARNRVKTVYPVLASFIQFLSGHTGMQLDTVSLIGHSLGAHISGLAAKQFKKPQISSIIALDPALPLFSMDKPAERIHADDAQYVESIQTDIGRLGMSKPVGQAAFYPNYGGPHPGCGLDLVGTCGHSRSWEFFSESITTQNGFWAQQCRNYVDIVDKKCIPSGATRQMGSEPVDKRFSGVFYLTTNKKSPFAQGA